MEKDFIGKRFTNIRMAKGISARELSIQLGQSAAYINHIENGRKMPSVEMLIEFCNFFNVTLSEFFDERQVFPIQYRELLKDLNKLSVDELNDVMALVRQITKYKK